MRRCLTPIVGTAHSDFIWNNNTAGTIDAGDGDDHVYGGSSAETIYAGIGMTSFLPEQETTRYTAAWAMTNSTAKKATITCKAMKDRTDLVAAPVRM